MLKVVVGILKSADKMKMLISQRPINKPYSGYWEFPGGKVEPGESALAALKREMQEELGIVVDEAQPCFDHIHQYPEKKVFLQVWRIVKFSGEVRPLEQQNLCWVSMDEIKTMQILDANWAILEKMKQQREENN